MGDFYEKRLRAAPASGRISSSWLKDGATPDKAEPVIDVSGTSVILYFKGMVKKCCAADLRED